MNKSRLLFQSIVSHIDPDDLKKKYSLTEVEFEDALKYEPFHEIHYLKEDVIKGFLKAEKEAFIAKNDFWDGKMYQEYNGIVISMVEVELKNYLNKIENKRYGYWEPIRKGFKFLTAEESYILFSYDHLDKIGSYECLVVTKMNMPKLRWYLSNVLNLLDEFIKNNDMVLDASTTENIEVNKPKVKLFAKHYVLAYLFDCKVDNIEPPNGNKTELERIGIERSNKEIDGNTFYKNFNEIYSQNLNSKDTLIQIGGYNWKVAILTLSQNPDKVEKYLKKIGL